MRSSPTPVTTAELAERAAQLVKQVHETSDAVVFLQEGQPAAVLLSAEEFALVQEHRRFVVAIERGLSDVQAGRVASTDDVKRSLESEFGPIRWQ